MRTTISLPDDLAMLVNLEAKRRQTTFSGAIRALIGEVLGGTAEKPREIPWAGLFDDPEMVPGKQIDAVLAEKWADDIDRDRG